MINLSISRLALTLITSSAASLTLTHRHKSFSLVHSAFKKSFSPAIFSSFPLSLTARSTVFERFLQSAICVDSSDYLNATLETGRICLLVGPVNVSYCIFRLCHSQDVSGGALFVIANLTLTQCLFSHNSSPFGGSVYSNGNFSVVSVTFEGGFSDQAGGFVSEASGGCSLGCYLVTFVNLESWNHSCLLRDSLGGAALGHCNISTNNADEQNAGIEIRTSPATLRHCIFFEMAAPRDTALVLRGVADSLVEICIFWLLQTSMKTDGATAFALRGTNATARLVGCSIFHCSPGGGAIIRAFDGGTIVITEMCSTADRVGLLGGEIGITIDQGSRFKHACDDKFYVDVPGHYGFHTFNAHSELVAMRSDMKDGVIVGALAVMVFAMTVVITMIILAQIAKVCTKDDEQYERVQ
jgi:predicted outer membrane repeat protein